MTSPCPAWPSIRRRARWPDGTGCGRGSRCPGSSRSRFISRSRSISGFGTELLITILFALSLDLVLGYAGIVTLGHAAFFGAGAYTVGMLAKHGIWNEPITGLVLAAAVAARRRPRLRLGAAAHRTA